MEILPWCTHFYVPTVHLNFRESSDVLGIHIDPDTRRKHGLAIDWLSIKNYKVLLLVIGEAREHLYGIPVQFQENGFRLFLLSWRRLSINLEATKEGINLGLQSFILV